MVGILHSQASILRSRCRHRRPLPEPPWEEDPEEEERVEEEPAEDEREADPLELRETLPEPAEAPLREPETAGRDAPTELPPELPVRFSWDAAPRPVMEEDGVVDRLPDEESVPEEERMEEESDRVVPRDSEPDEPETLRPEEPRSISEFRLSEPRLDVESVSR